MGKGKIKKPVSGGVAKVPVVMQMEALECGAAALTMVLAYYGRWVPLEQIRADCGVSRDGSNAKNMLLAARSYGLEAHGYRIEPAVLRKEGQFPCIIHWQFNHFVVLDGFKGDKAIINDPAKGVCQISMEDFDRSFTGVCLLFEPTEDFVPGGKPKSMAAYAMTRLKNAGTAVAFVMLTTIISSLIGVLYPAFSRVFLDRLLTGRNPQWLWPFLLGLAVVSLLQLVAAGINAIYSLRIMGKLSAIGSTTFFWKVLHMPMEFFSQRMAGDIQQRQSTNASIASDLVDTVAPLALNAVMAVFYLVVMVRYSRFLSVLGLISIAVNVAVSRTVSKKWVNITRVQMRDASKLSASTLAGIEMIETIKASGAENGYFERWAGYQASVNSQQMRFQNLNRYLGRIPALVGILTDQAMVFFGVLFVIRGQFTIGMVMAFQGFFAAFQSPAMSLISAGQTVQQMRAEMERVEDVMQYPADRNMTQEVPPDPEGEGYDKLSGAVELRHVTFGYSRLAEPLIEDFNLSLKPGSRVALVGSSGCGKSTISKLISGLYEPWSGQILFDGKTIRQIDRSVFTGSLAVVDQDIILFEDTIANNIKMWDSSIEDFEMILAARDADIHSDIVQRAGGYNYKLAEGGKDFSGGQRQRLEIARVLAQDPTIIILDEATSALDAKTEHEVVDSIKNRGITCVVVAHRLSTIRDCDEIIVMDHGKVVERGTHEQLYAMNGYYTRLVSND